MGQTEDWSEFVQPHLAKEVELAGKWKHGWIPLDATAIASKMKGKTGGKKWWKGGDGSKAVGVPKKGTKSRRDGLGDTIASQTQVRKGGPAVPGSARIHGAENGKRITAKMTPSEAAERGLDRKAGSMLTVKEVPSAGFKKRPAKGASKAPYQNGKIGAVNETKRFGYGDLSSKEIQDYNSLAGRTRAETVEKRNVYMNSRRAGRSHANAMRAARKATIGGSKPGKA